MEDRDNIEVQESQINSVLATYSSSEDVSYKTTYSAAS